MSNFIDYDSFVVSDDAMDKLLNICKRLFIDDYVSTYGVYPSIELINEVTISDDALERYKHKCYTKYLINEANKIDVEPSEPSEPPHQSGNLCMFYAFWDDKIKRLISDDQKEYIIIPQINPLELNDGSRYIIVGYVIENYSDNICGVYDMQCEEVLVKSIIYDIDISEHDKEYICDPIVGISIDNRNSHYIDMSITIDLNIQSGPKHLINMVIVDEQPNNIIVEIRHNSFKDSVYWGEDNVGIVTEKIGWSIPDSWLNKNITIKYLAYVDINKKPHTTEEKIISL